MKKNYAKSEMIETLANKFKLTDEKSKSAVNTILDEMINTLASGNRIEIRGFGSFVSGP